MEMKEIITDRKDSIIMECDMCTKNVNNLTYVNDMWVCGFCSKNCQGYSPPKPTPLSQDEWI